MKINSFLMVLVTTLLLFSVSNSPVQAQNNPQVCLACAPSLGTFDVQVPPNCSYRRFLIGSGLNGRCTRLSYDWTVTSTGTGSGQVENYYGGDALIKFSESGDYTVCVTMTIGFDRNGDGTISSMEQCQVSKCITLYVDTTFPCQ